MNLERSLTRRAVTTRRRAYTMLEVVAVVFVVGALSLTALAQLSKAGAPGSDTEAKAALAQMIEIQTTEMMANRSPSPDISGRTSSVVFTSSPSSAPNQVSMIVAGNVVAGAASNGSGSCWMVRRDFDGTTAPVVWSVTDSGTCTGTRALGTGLSGDLGLNPDSPVVVE